MGWVDAGWGGDGRHNAGTPQDKSSDSEDDRHSASEEDSDEEDSAEEDRDGDVDQGFREQLMAVLQAGKALVSQRRGRREAPRLQAAAGCSAASVPRARWTVRTTTRSWGTRP